MSIDSARIVCTDCDYETRELYRPIRIRYETFNGKTVETGRAKGWCYKCGSYSDIENLDQGDLHSKLVSKESERRDARQRLDEIDSGFLASLRHRTERRELQYQLERLDEELAEVGCLLEIAKNRRSKARCLKCWSDYTAPVSFDSGDGVAHDFVHDCGGNLQIINDQSGPRFHFRVATYILNEEGELIGEE